MGWLNNLINKAKKKTEETVQGAVQQGQQVVQNAVAQGQQAVQNVSSGYGDWLNGVEQQVTPIVQSAVQQGQQTVQGVIDQGNQAIEQGVQYAKDAAGNLVEQATPVVQNAAQGAIQQGQQAVQGAVQQGQQIVQNTVQNASQAVTDKVNDINNQIQGNTTPQPPATAVPTTPNNQVPTATPVTTPTQTTPTVQQQTPTNTTTQENSTFSVDEPILSYEDYLKKESEGLGYIKDKVTQQTDQQNSETLKHIDETLASGNKYAEDVKSTTDAALEAQKKADVAYAESQRDLMKDTSQAERDAVYKYAEETLAGALGYNNEAYGKLVEAITGQMEAGKLAASEAKNLLMIMAEEAKNTTYGAAERQRQEAERQADINRQRAIADANSAYEQNKASYGAKAEALGNMGLTAGGYGDWLNASAYAQNRSEVQGARAQSDAAKREAKYTEDMTKLQADQEYSNKKYQAESDYQSKLYDIDTSYRTNMSEAEQSKLAADKAAQDAEREAKRQADSKHSENVYNADSSYADWINKAETAEREGKLQSDIEYKGFLYETEQEAKDQKLQVNQDAANKKLQAEISYVEGILGNSKALAEYKESLKAGDAAAEEKKLAVYEQLLKGVNDGTYTAEDAAALADAFELGEKWKNAIATSAGNKAEADANAKAEDEQMQNRQDYTSVLVGVANGELDEATATALAKEYGFSKEQTDAIIKAAQGRASGATGDMFIDALINASNGKLDEATATAIAKQYGFDEEQTKAVVKAVQGAADKVQKEQRTQNFNTLLDRAKTGTLTKDEVMQMASELGFDANNPDDKKLLDLIGSAADRYATATEEEKKYQKNMNVLTLLDGAKTGAYSVDEIDDIASMLGLDLSKDAGLINMIKTAAGDYADGVTKSEEQQKTASFINLLGSANAGELTNDELSQIASELGLSKEQKTLLTTAAGRYQTGSEEEKSAQKTMNFISLLDGANTGAYNSEQIAQMAEMLGIDPKNEADKKLIGMLKTAADDFAAGEAGKTAKEDMQYQNGIYAELLAAANNGDYTEAQIKELAKRFGIEDTDGILAEAARLAQEGKDKTTSENSALNIIDLKDRGYITSDTSDDEIQDYIDAGLIAEGDLEKVKEERTKMATTEVEDLIKSGNYKGAIERAEELYAEGTGNLDPDTYQKAYFEGQKNNCSQVKTVDDIKTCEADLKNALSAGQISQADYDSLVNYMYQSVGGKLDSSAYTANRTSEYDIVSALNAGFLGDMSQYKHKVMLTIGIDGNEYKVQVNGNGNADNNTSKILNSISGGNPKVNTLVMFEGQLYCYDGKGQWNKINDTNGLYNAYNKQVGYQPKVTAPKHTSSGEGGSGAAGGVGGIGGGVGKNIVHTYK